MLRVQIPPLPKQPAAAPTPIAPAAPVDDKPDALTNAVVVEIFEIRRRLRHLELLLIANLSVSATALIASLYLVFR